MAKRRNQQRKMILSFEQIVRVGLQGLGRCPRPSPFGETRYSAAMSAETAPTGLENCNPADEAHHP